MSFSRDDERGYSRAHVYGDVTGEADMEELYGLSRMFTPDRVEIEYRKAAGGDGPWILGGVVVSGFAHKKDGTPGLRPVNAYYSRGTLDNAPRWVRTLVKDQRPDPLLDALTGSLTGVYGDGSDSDRRGALRLALSRLTDEQTATLATALTDAAPFVGEALTARIVARRES